MVCSFWLMRDLDGASSGGRGCREKGGQMQDASTQKSLWR